MPGIILNHKTAATAYLFLLMAVALAAAVMLAKHGAAPHFGAYVHNGAKPDYLYNG